MIHMKYQALFKFIKKKQIFKYLQILGGSRIKLTKLWPIELSSFLVVQFVSFCDGRYDFTHFLYREIVPFNI